MPIGPTRRRLAILIDAENVPSTIAPRLMAATASLGEARVLRCYGGLGALRDWKAAITTHAIEARAIPSGKNAADIALIIDAMDLIHAGAADGLCLASRDSDFRALAVRAREAGVLCHGFSHLEPPASLRNACDSFTVLKSLADLILKAMGKSDEMSLAQLGSELRDLGYVRGEHGPGPLRKVVASCPAVIVTPENIVHRRPAIRLIAAE